MAEGVLFSVAEGILETLVPLITNEIVLPWGFKNELQNLRSKVSIIKAVLLDAEEQRTKNNAVNLWLEKLSDVLYEAEDLLDAISTEALQRKIKPDKNVRKVRKFFSPLKQPIHVLNMGQRIKDIRGNIDAIADDIPRFQFLERQNDEGLRFLRRGDTHSFLGEEIVIGRDGDKKAVIDRLMVSEVDKNVSIVTIIGIGGLGKTTLTRIIFNDREIQKTFQLKMWICVSDPFDVKLIVKKIVESATKKIPKSDQMEVLVEDLRKGIEGKKYLLVLDDVWCEARTKWSDLYNLLSCGGRGSKILVTTRKLGVAKIMRTEPYELRGLGDNDSWELFKQEAFKNVSELGSLEGMGREILKKCKGVPLAIKTVGRLLYSKSSKEWQRFIKYELSKIEQEEEDIIPTLKLSYDELSSNLKHCFAFCSLFPKDHEFDIATLINHWIAQGFVDLQEDQCVGNVGNEYFKTLLWRSFFQEVSVDEWGELSRCKMHDLMHDLATLVAGAFMTTFTSGNSNKLERVRHIAVTPGTTFDFVEMSSLYKVQKIRSFLCPSFFTYYHRGHYMAVDCEAIIKSSKNLRMLDLTGRLQTSVPKSIGELKHLRFVNFSFNERIKVLPNSISELVNLQYLCLSHCGGIVELPRDFKNLVNLRILDAYGCMMQYLPQGFEKLVKLKRLDLGCCKVLMHLPHGIGQLTDLETLNLNSCVSLEELPKDIGKLVNLRFLDIRDCCKVSYVPCGFEKLTNLKTLLGFEDYQSSPSEDSIGLDALSNLNDLAGNLTIRGLSCGEGVVTRYKAANLKGKEHLNSLQLEWSNEAVVNGLDDDLSLEGLQPHPNLKRLKLRGCWCPKHPSWLSLLISLVSLSLKGCSKWQYLAPLNHLPSLERLKLCDMKGMEYTTDLGKRSDLFDSSSAQMTFFPSLKEMTLTDCPNLKGWWGGSPAEDDNLALSFPLLSRLRIVNCPMLTSMPMFPHVEESLLLDNTSWKPLQQTLMMNMTAVVASSGTPLSKLKIIEFDSVVDLEALPEEGLQNLTSLESLCFISCDNLKSLSPGVQYLTTVQKLYIGNCPMFVEDENGMQWQGLKSLTALSLESLPKLSSLPPGVQYLTTVQNLYIENCPMFVEDENGMQWQGLKSLTDLFLESLPKLSSLPPGVQYLTTVQKLYIENCPMFVEDENGMQWQGLKSLRDLSLRSLPKLSSLPSALQHVPTLKEILIADCECFTTIPEWIHQCKSLEDLTIRNCPNLASLPVETCERWSLKCLEIVGCPILSQKCEKEKGEYWPKIVDIPELHVGCSPRMIREIRPWEASGPRSLCMLETWLCLMLLQR